MNIEINIIPIEDDKATQEQMGITAEDLQDKNYWELAVDAGLITH